MLLWHVAPNNTHHKMNFAGFLYKQCLSNQGEATLYSKFLSKNFQRIRAAILKIADPTCRMEVHGIELDIPLSHPLPLFHSTNPLCDKLLGRVAAWLRARGEAITYVDVGANIGDTVAAIHPTESDFVLAFEPHPHYALLLRRNASQFPCDIEIQEKACVSPEHVKSVTSVSGSQGTGRIEVADGVSGGIQTTTLDQAIFQSPRSKLCNLIKTDVDGFDFEVLKGAGEIIRKNQPIILIESDVFSNSNYAGDLQSLCETLRESGYRDMILYDNYGGLFYAGSTSDLERITSLFFYQVTRKRIYFDILFGPDLSLFLENELKFFSENTPDPTRRKVANDLIGAMSPQMLSLP